MAQQRSASRRDFNAVHKAADAHLAAVTKAVYYAFAKGRKVLRETSVRNASGAADAVRVALREALPPALAACFSASARAGLAPLLRTSALRVLRPQREGEPHSSEPPFDLAFNEDDPRAVAWAEEHVGDLIDDIAETTRDDIRAAVADALAGEGLDAAYDDILAAVGDEARAEMIARTETMDAANEGLAEGWDAAQEAGLLGEDAKKVWIATSGACDDCDDVDGEEVPLDEDFSVGDDPPLHPNCRCTMGIA